MPTSSRSPRSKVWSPWPVTVATTRKSVDKSMTRLLKLSKRTTGEDGPGVDIRFGILVPQSGRLGCSPPTVIELISL